MTAVVCAGMAVRVVVADRACVLAGMAGAFHLQRGVVDAEFLQKHRLRTRLDGIGLAPGTVLDDDMRVERVAALFHLPEMGMVDAFDTLDGSQAGNDLFRRNFRRACEHENADHRSYSVEGMPQDIAGDQ